MYAQQQLTEDILVAMKKYESSIRSERVKQGIKAAKRKGKKVYAK